MKLSRIPLFLLAAALAAGLASSEARTWTQAATGNKIEAEFVRLEGETVILNVAGREAQVPLAQLVEADQEYARSAVAGSTGTGGGGASAGDWPRWRGADVSGISGEAGLAKQWPSSGPEQLWVYENAGMGYSSFSVVDGKLFTLGTRGADLHAICVDASSGEEIWATRISADDQQGYNAGWGHGPRSTPTWDEGHIYALGPKGELACLDAASGELIWSKNLRDDFGGQPGGWGFSESPLVDGDKVVVGPGGNQAGIVALDKKTGETIWKAEEVKPGKAEYSSIVPVEMNGKRQYVRLFESQLVSVDADSGALLWQTEWPGTTAVIPTPIVDGNEVYITSGYGVGSKLVRVSEGNEAADVWVNTVMKNHHGGVVKIGDHVYGFSDAAGFMCQDWKTGEMVWNERAGGKLVKGSVTAVDGRLICLNEDDGTVTMLEASPRGYKELGQFKLSPQSENRHAQGKVWAHPVVAGGKLYLRDQEYIVCYDLRG